MTLSDLFILCSHGRRSAHSVGRLQTNVGWCPGGRPATLGDLSTLGSQVWWCEVHHVGTSEHDDEPWESGCIYEGEWGMGNPANCQITERILLPLPQLVAEEESQ